MAHAWAMDAAGARASNNTTSTNACPAACIAKIRSRPLEQCTASRRTAPHRIYTTLHCHRFAVPPAGMSPSFLPPPLAQLAVGRLSRGSARCRHYPSIWRFTHPTGTSVTYSMTSTAPRACRIIVGSTAFATDC